MAVAVSNLIMGPGQLYLGAFGAVEPLDSAIGTAPDPAIWRDLGGTNDGVSLTVDQTFQELDVDQVVDIPGRRLTKRELMFSTNLAEMTLDNLALSLNDPTGVVKTSGLEKYTPKNSIDATQPGLFALLFDGFAPNGMRRRVIARRTMSSDKVEFAYKKGDQSVYKVTFSALYVSTTIAPWTFTDQVAVSGS